MPHPFSQHVERHPGSNGVRTIAVLVFLTCSLAMAAAYAEVYRWVDDQGKVHYSDAPPRGTAAKKIELPVTTPQQRENAQQRLKAFLDQRKAQEAIHNQEQAEKREAQATKLREKEERLGHCLAAQEQLDLLQLGRPVFEMDEKGQRVYLEDKDRPAETSTSKRRNRYLPQEQDPRKRIYARTGGAILV